MPNDFFHFKQFTILQDRCAMKVGTDGVLLGAWARVPSGGKILDIGTGTGLIALMLAQRCTAEIHAVEIDQKAAGQAEENFQRSPWASRMQVYSQPYQEFSVNGGLYDLIVTNPPYFAFSLPAKGHERTLARHHNSLPLNDLMVGVTRQLAEQGRFAVIYPSSDFPGMQETASALGLFLIRKTRVIPAPHKAASRVLVEFSKKRQTPAEDELIIETNGRHNYSKAFRELTDNYYLAK